MALPSLLPWRRRSEDIVVRHDPFSALQHEMSDLFENFFTDFEFPEAGVGRFTPRIDMSEDDNAIHIVAELPGMDEKDLDISLSENTVTIKGEKRREEKEERHGYRSERMYGDFERTVRLPCEVKSDKAQASFKNGVVSITLPKADETRRTRKIEVTAG